MEVKIMRELVENYQSNKEKLDRLNEKLVALMEYNLKITAAYSLAAARSEGTVNSKVENYAIRIKETEEKIFKVGNQISVVDIACRVLNNAELEVIELIKKGYRNRVTKMAKILHKDKSYISNTRNRAIQKMSEYIGDKYGRYI